MKFSKKMILIPSTGREEPETEKMSELDMEMSRVLKNTSLSIKEKVEKYNEILRRNIVFENRLLQKPVSEEKSNPNDIGQEKSEPKITLKDEKTEEEEEEEYKEEEAEKENEYESKSLFNISHHPTFLPHDYSNLKTPIFKGFDLTKNYDNTFEWDDIDNLVLTHDLRNKNRINYEESPSSLLHSETKRKKNKKKKKGRKNK